MKQFECDTVDDETIQIMDIEEFLTDNDFDRSDPELARTIRTMSIGQEIREGGGAAPEWALRRLQ